MSCCCWTWLLTLWKTWVQPWIPVNSRCGSCCVTRSASLLASRGGCRQGGVTCNWIHAAVHWGVRGGELGGLGGIKGAHKKLGAVPATDATGAGWRPRRSVLLWVHDPPPPSSSFRGKHTCRMIHIHVANVTQCWSGERKPLEIRMVHV